MNEEAYLMLETFDPFVLNDEHDTPAQSATIALLDEFRKYLIEKGNSDSDYAIAKHLGVSNQYVSKWRTAKVAMGDRYIADICRQMYDEETVLRWLGYWHERFCAERTGEPTLAAIHHQLSAMIANSLSRDGAVLRCVVTVFATIFWFPTIFTSASQYILC